MRTESEVLVSHTRGILRQIRQSGIDLDYLIDAGQPERRHLPVLKKSYGPNDTPSMLKSLIYSEDPQGIVKDECGRVGKCWEVATRRADELCTQHRVMRKQCVMAAG